MKARRLYPNSFAISFRAVLCGLICALFARFAPARADMVVDRVVASVDGEPITMHDVRAFSASEGKPIPPDPSPRAPNLVRSALKQLIEEKLLETETKSFASQVDDAQVDKFIENIRNQNNLSEDQFKEQLLRSGTTYEQFRRRARLELEKMVMIDRNVRSKITVPDADVKAYYDAHPDEFMNKSERYRIAQILIAVSPSAPPADIAAAKAKAEKIRARIVAGEDFGSMASQYSDDDSKNKGGELGYFAPDEILDLIKAAIVNLKPGEISKVIQTNHGFHILKLEEHDLPGRKPFESVKEEIRDKLVDQRAKGKFQQWLDEELVKKHHVESFY